MNKLILMIIVLLTFGLIAQEEKEKSSEQTKVEQAVLEWAGENIKEFSEHRFEEFNPDYTDEYMMAKMRGDALKKNISRLKNQKEDGTYNGSEEDFNKALKVLEQRNKEVDERLIDFHPKVTAYEISFLVNTKQDTENQDLIEYKITVDDYFKVVDYKVDDLGRDK